MVDFISSLPDYLRKFVDPSLPKEQRLNAARGLIAIPPKDLVKVLYSLILDEDEEISKEAKASLKSMPDEVIGTVLDDTSTSSELLDYIARNTASEFQLQNMIVKMIRVRMFLKRLLILKYRRMMKKRKLNLLYLKISMNLFSMALISLMILQRKLGKR